MCSILNKKTGESKVSRMFKVVQSSYLLSKLVGPVSEITMKFIGVIFELLYGSGKIIDDLWLAS